MIDTGEIRGGEETIVHFGGIRLRVKGAGLIRPTFYSLDNVRSQALVPIQMFSSTDIIPTRLANFNTQRAYLKLETTDLNETFNINRVIVFVKPIYISYPG